MDYETADWGTRAKFFMNDARNHIALAGSLYNTAQNMISSPIPRQKDAENLMKMAQVLATMSQTFMTGAQVCLTASMLGLSNAEAKPGQEQVDGGVPEEPSEAPKPPRLLRSDS